MAECSGCILEAFHSYLRDHPRGRFLEEARTKISAIEVTVSRAKEEPEQGRRAEEDQQSETGRRKQTTAHLAQRQPEAAKSKAKAEPIVPVTFMLGAKGASRREVLKPGESFRDLAQFTGDGCYPTR